MAGEASTADFAATQEKQKAYQVGLQNFIAAQAQPQSFLEHPATRYIPLAGRILSDIGAMNQRKRMQDAALRSTYFDEAVQSGDLTPDHPATQGIPLPIIQAGLLQAQKVRATPGYQGRQLFQEAMPSWQGQLQGVYEDIPPGGTTSPQLAQEQAQRHLENFKAFAQQNPEIFGALGSPETGRIALENIYTPAGVQRMRQRGYEIPGYPQVGSVSQPSGQPPGATPQGEITQTPLQSPPPPPTQEAPVTPAFREKVTALSERLGIQPDDLMKVMHFETAGSFSPSQVNKAGSGATGLIQFLPRTARAMGTTTEALARMTAEEQLDYVEKYLEPYKGRIHNLHDLYMAVLYPEALGKGQAYILFRQGSKEYTQNAGLDVDRKGYVTAGDATRMMEMASSQTGARPSAEAPTGQMVAGPGAPTPQTQPPQPPSIQEQVRRVPLGSFNPNGPRPIVKRTDRQDGGKIGWTDEEMSLQDYAAGWLADQVDQNPLNYRAAYRELAQKRALPPPEQMRMIQAGTAAKIFATHEASLANQGYKGVPLAIEAMKRTLDDMGVGLTPEIINALGSNPLLSETIEYLKHHGGILARTTPAAQLERRQQTEEALYKSGQEQIQTGEIRADMPLSQLPDGPAIAQKYGVPGTTTLRDLNQRVLLPDDLQKEGAAIDKLVQGLDLLKRYYTATDPREQDTFLAALEGHFKSWGTGLGINPNVKDYKDMVTAFARVLGTITTETGGKYTKEDVEQYLMAIPNEKLTAERALPRFQAFEEMVTAPYYSRLKSYLSGEAPLMEKFRKRYPAMAPTQPSAGTPPPTAPPPGAPLVPVPGTGR